MMRLVVDTSILISALLKDSMTREILLLSTVEFLIPEYAFEEFEKHKNTISKRSGLKNEEIDLLMALLMENITIVPFLKLKPYMDKAYKIMGEIDHCDVPFIALALAVENDGIWSNDRHFEDLKDIKVWKTPDVLKYVKTRK